MINIEFMFKASLKRKFGGFFAEHMDEFRRKGERLIMNFLCLDLLRIQLGYWNSVEADLL